MEKKGWMMLRVLINRYNPKAGNALLKFLPEETLNAVTSLDIQSTDLTPILEQPKTTVTKIHYSWLKPIFDNLSDRLKPIFLASLTPEQIEGLHDVKQEPIKISNFVKIFIHNHLYKLLKIGDYYPIEYLPETDMSFLAKCPKQRLITIMDFLGIHDLAVEVRRIVNPIYLKNIYSCLTPKQLQYLKLCLHQKEQITSPRLGFDMTKQDCKRLKQIIHRRGLLRLGKALSGQNADYVWHLAHHLDKGRGELLLKEYQTETSPKVTSVLKQQVLQVNNFLNEQ